MEAMLDFMPLWGVLFALFVVGACVGSCISLISYRLPRDEPVVCTRSRCPKCHAVLGARDLVPLLSWLWHRGACRHCGVAVSMRYPLLEVTCAMGAVVLVLGLGVSALTLVYIALWWLAVALIITDLEHYIILDEIQIALALLAGVYAMVAAIAWQDMLLSAGTGLIIGLALKYGFLLIARKDGLGMGDVKFLAVAGLWLANPASFVPFLFLSGVLGIVSGLLWRALGRGALFPFGPALVISLLACVYHLPIASGFWRLYGFLQH
jgi:leader peptidase (prepilin peptidase)/N-methyltransferase